MERVLIILSVHPDSVDGQHLAATLVRLATATTEPSEESERLTEDGRVGGAKAATTHVDTGRIVPGRPGLIEVDVPVGNAGNPPTGARLAYPYGVASMQVATLNLTVDAGGGQNDAAALPCCSAAPAPARARAGTGTAAPPPCPFRSPRRRCRAWERPPPRLPPRRVRG
jgi:hypothetical protein